MSYQKINLKRQSTKYFTNPGFSLSAFVCGKRRNASIRVLEIAVNSFPNLHKHFKVAGYIIPGKLNSFTPCDDQHKLVVEFTHDDPGHNDIDLYFIEIHTNGYVKEDNND